MCADGNNTVSKTVNNTKVFSYTNDKLSCARGIDVDCDGNCYICGYESGYKHQITKDGKLVRIIPAASIGIVKPWVLRFQKYSNDFFCHMPSNRESGLVRNCLKLKSNISTIQIK